MTNQYGDHTLEQELLATQGIRRCYRCKQIKNIEEFYKCNQRKSGIYAYCKACEKERYAERKSNDPVKWIANRMSSDIRERSRHRNIPCNITTSFIEQKLRVGVCEVTGVKLVASKDFANPFSPSIDRINPELGYLKSNCRLVCMGFNALRGTGTDLDALKIALGIVQSLSPVYMARAFGEAYTKSNIIQMPMFSAQETAA